MQRIDTGDNLFSAGDPENNIKGTMVPAVILNTWQEELANAIEGFGETLDPEKDDQLLTILTARCWKAGDEIMLPYVPTTQEMTDRRMLERDGSSLLRADYPALFAKIGTMYGAADGTHFNLPDDRGLFPRIWDHGAGVDPDAATRTDRGDGTTGDNVGTLQSDENKLHRHSMDQHTTSTSVYLGGSSSTDGIKENTSEPYAFPNIMSEEGGDEARPKNRNKWGGIFY
ncbi:MAG: phage tail protein [Desulfobacula sp.]|nr:phage tail protein [Desulfobacula sp.]